MHIGKKQYPLVPLLTSVMWPVIITAGNQVLCQGDGEGIGPHAEAPMMSITQKVKKGKEEENSENEQERSMKWIHFEQWRLSPLLPHNREEKIVKTKLCFFSLLLLVHVQFCHSHLLLLL
ncbi:hypothetical protein H1C71_022531 [Ictidomys tridecemlineatus]|nr:hypothetical protein H1C71_022531 [Ictidomys tridecemlineatus]